jgi:integrase/recombinase XerD
MVAGPRVIEADPTIGIERRPAPPDRTKALSKPQITALWQLNASVREKTFWKLLYESAARADEILCLNIEGLFPPDKRGRVVSKGGAIEWILSPALRLPLPDRLVKAAAHARGIESHPWPAPTAVTGDVR